MMNSASQWIRNKTLIHNAFKHFESKKLDLLNDDKKWLEKLLTNVPAEKLSFLLNEYEHKWHEGVRNEVDEHKKQNKGRYAANSWIREKIEGA